MKEIIDKAVRGGFSEDFGGMIKQFLNPDNHSCKIVSDMLVRENFEKIIFSHEFLRAYFPKTDRYDVGIICIGECPDSAFEKVGEVWQYHAQQLVLSEDKEEYLRRYLD